MADMPEGLSSAMPGEDQVHSHLGSLRLIRRGGQRHNPMGDCLNLPSHTLQDSLCVPNGGHARFHEAVRWAVEGGVAPRGRGLFLGLPLARLLIVELYATDAAVTLWGHKRERAGKAHAANGGATDFVIQMTGFVIRIFLYIFYAYSLSILVGISYSNHIPIIAHIVQHIPAYSSIFHWNMLEYDGDNP